MLVRETLLLIAAAVGAPLAQTPQAAATQAPSPQSTPGTQAQVEQSHQTSPAFEVASVRPEDPNEMAHMLRMSFSEDGYSARNATVPPPCRMFNATTVASVCICCDTTPRAHHWPL